ncbi:FRG domain-containing protein [Halocella sp. SP3-1]|uniref:FRG domain-containing protein n=1 Tax=Halocella sp. SP3-1 TaxID=2382161 RepID=UPI0013DF336A|nr:FRG domain-containing protein [Halocella sp. SP3-1]
MNVKSLEEYVSAIEIISNNQNKIFYRGQASSKKYNLLPSFLRVDENGKRKYHRECEIQFLNKFKSRATPYLNNIPKNNWEWLFLMQHYRTPTRLLDWTESPLISLYFALADTSFKYDENDNPVVWCLNALKLNKNVKELPPYLDDIPNVNSDEIWMNSIEKNYGIGKYTYDKYPIAIYGPFNNDRINAQKGVFTLFSNSSICIEDLKGSDDLLDKIIIDKESINKIRLQLFNFGITNTIIYPELESISEDIKLEYFIKKKGEWVK